MTYDSQRDAISCKDDPPAPDETTHVYGDPEKDLRQGQRLCSSQNLGERVVFHVEADCLSGVWYCAACGEVADIEA